MSDIKTVVDFGADPTGRKDSSAAFQAMADSDDTSVVTMPFGDFVIAKTVDLKGKSLQGHGRNRGPRGSRVRCSGGIDGPMFVNQGAVVSDFNLWGTGETNGKTAFAAGGYNSLFQNIDFNQVETAIDVEYGTVNFSVVDCRFVMVDTGMRCRDVNNDQSTTTRFVRNEFNNCRNAVVYDRMMVGFLFVQNIFEYLSGDAVIASHVYKANFIGNWWEKRRPSGEPSSFGQPNTDGGYPPVRATSNQQIMNGFAAANSTSWGWRDDFSTDRHNGAMGGVSVNSGEVVVRDSTGRGLRIDDSSIVRESAEWAGLGPMVIDAGYNRTGRPGMALRTGGGPLKLENAEGDEFTGELVFARSGGLEERLYPNRNLRDEHTPGLVGISEVEVNGETQKALTGIPQFFLWRQDKLARGLDALESHEVVSTGVVRMFLPYVIDNPLVTVTPYDQGVRFDGLEYVESYVNGSRSRVQCRGFDLRFVNQDGEPVTPEAFAVQLLTVAPGIL